jgi:hypothetical protein
MFTVMQSSTKVPVSAKAAENANAYSASILGLFGSTSLRSFHSLQSNVQDQATSQALAVLTQTAQGVLFGATTVVPNTQYSSFGPTYDLYAAVNAPGSLQANIRSNTSIDLAVSLTGTNLIGFVRITFRSNPRAYVTTVLDPASKVVAFALFDSASFITSSPVTVTYTGLSNGVVNRWDLSSNGTMVSGWTSCGGPCTLVTPFQPSEFAYVKSAATNPPTPAPTTPSPTPVPPIGATNAPKSSSEDLAWIAGPIIGGVVFIALVVGGIIYFQKRNAAQSDSAQRVQDDSAEVAEEHRV